MPLRPISQGSLFRLSRSGAYPDAPHGLGFFEPALSEFLDEIEAMQTNLKSQEFETQWQVLIYKNPKLNLYLYSLHRLHV